MWKKKRGVLVKTPEDYSAEMAAEFEKVWESLHISYDQFIRTDLPIHKRSVSRLFQIIHDNGYIFQGTYEGYYCASCEEFVQEKDLAEGGLCPRHQEKAQWLEEKNYFFALSKFSDALKKHIEDHPEFIQPEIRKNEILNVIEQGLEDVSVSRVGKTWGVPLPIAEGHVVYVWFDALINYISALGYGDDDTASLTNTGRRTAMSSAKISHDFIVSSGPPCSWRRTCPSRRACLRMALSIPREPR